MIRSEAVRTVGGHAYGVTVRDDHVYWSNARTGTIGRANLNGTDVDHAFVSGLDGSGINPAFVTGIALPVALTAA